MPFDNAQDLMLDIAAEYHARAADERAKAVAATLPNVRALHLRAAEAWEAMARKVDHVTECAATNKAAKDTADMPGSLRS